MRLARNLFSFSNDLSVYLDFLGKIDNLRKNGGFFFYFSPLSPFFKTSNLFETKAKSYKKLFIKYRFIRS